MVCSCATKSYVSCQIMSSYVYMLPSLDMVTCLQLMENSQEGDKKQRQKGSSSVDSGQWLLALLNGHITELGPVFHKHSKEDSRMIT
jgi:hypothetical protein